MNIERTCGSCTACCKTHSVPEVAKVAGAWCPHCEIGKGCGIYASRPVSCQDFKCSWLLGNGELCHRPDKTKVVPDFREIERIGMAMWFFEVSKGALESRFVKAWSLQNLLGGNCVVHVPLVQTAKLYLSKRIVGRRFLFVIDGKDEKAEIIQYVDSVRMLS